MLKLESKFKKVYSDLKGRIIAMPSGQRLPTMREVMEEFNVSQVTVDRALNLLSKEGLIVRSLRKGTYVSDGKVPKRKAQTFQIALALPDYPSPLWASFLPSFRKHIGRIGELSKVIRFDWQDRVLRTLPRERIDGLILFPAAAKYEPGDLQRIKDFKIPVVVMSRISNDIAMDYVSTDDAFGGALAAEHLLSLGHRKLAVLISEPHVPTVEAKVEGFYNRARLAGIEDVEIIDCRTQSGESSGQNAYDNLKSKIETLGLTFSAIFVVSDASALGAIKACHVLGIEIPKQLSLVGSDGIPEGSLYHPALTTIFIDRDQEVQAAVEILACRLAGDKADALQRSIRPRLVVRESTGPCAAAIIN
jgi:DNA-binding LacI/PurR family transcriptional regulator